MQSFWAASRGIGTTPDALMGGVYTSARGVGDLAIVPGFVAHQRISRVTAVVVAIWKSIHACHCTATSSTYPLHTGDGGDGGGGGGGG